MIKELKKWMIENYLDFKFIEDDVVEVEGLGLMFVFDSKDENVFDESFDLNLSVVDTDRDELLYEDLIYTIYKFGDVFYYTNNNEEVAEMNPFRCVGKAFLSIEDNHTHLGVHGFREILNGSDDYETYAKQAKFFGYKSIGIAEKNTLAGCLLFQNACKKNKVKSVLGVTIHVLHNEEKHEAKIYCKNETGWTNAMNICNIINNRDHEISAIQLQELLDYSEGNYFVFSKNWIPNDDLVSKTSNCFEKVFYQIDSSEYSSDVIDEHYLNKTSEYFEKYGFDSKSLPPILISDSYYVHKSDNKAKKILNQIGIGASHLQSEDQFFKPLEYHMDKLDPLIKNKDYDSYDNMISNANENTMFIAVDSDFSINTDKINMPEYELTDEEKLKYKDKYELFDSVIDSNWDKRVPEGMDSEYEDRLEEEFRVIDGNGFLDYFLINWDWIQFCKRKNIYTGIARGSAGGSVLSYLLGVTNIDPIKYDLLFERFLNEGRLKKTIKTRIILFISKNGESIVQYREDELIKANNGYFRADEIRVGDRISGIEIGEIKDEIIKEVTAGSPPDIDSDVESVGRQSVKEYLENRYGKHRVFSIGTFVSLGIKSAISDVAKLRGVNIKTVKSVTKMITNKEAASGFTLKDFFIKAQTNSLVKNFILDYPDVIEATRLIVGNSKSPSVHAAGVVITPKTKNGELANAWDWTPTKLYDDQMISEWEGEHLEQSGMLKLDLLGLNTLDKIHYVVDSVEKNTNEKIDWHDIYINRLEDKKAFQIFKDGFTQNVFQFSSEDMTKFIQSMQPSCIDDIIAANALFRPATMNLGYHDDYVEMKHGRKEVDYDWGMEEITKDTYGILCYQEQHMKTVQKIGGFSLQEADDVRKAMGKKKVDLMESYRVKFINGSVKNGCDELDAIKIWNDIEQGAEYGFNRSHAAAYGLESYVTAYLKAHYPVHFYTMSLAMAKDDKRAPILSEINNDGRITIAPPHINESGFDFETDFDKNKIYWALKSTKMVGDVAVKSIISIRDTDGDYKSLKDFVKRTAGKKVNKNHVINLILSGAFDELEKLETSIGRFNLIKWYYNDILKGEMPKETYPMKSVKNTFFWNRIQYELSGLGYIDYKKVYSGSSLNNKQNRSPYLVPENLNKESNNGKFFTVCGTISEVSEFNSKKNGTKFGKISLQSNSIVINVMLWSDEWDKYGETMIKSKGLIVVVNGKMSLDEYSGTNQMMMSKKSKLEII